MTAAHQLFRRQHDPVTPRNVAELVAQVSEGDAATFLVQFGQLAPKLGLMIGVAGWTANRAGDQMKRPLPDDQGVEIGAMRFDCARFEGLPARSPPLPQGALRSGDACGTPPQTTPADSW